MAKDKKEPVKKDQSVIDYRQMGVTGVKRFGGWIYEEFLPELTGSRGIEIYKEMGDNEPTIGAFLQAIDKLCRAVPWRVEPASQKDYDLEAAEFLEQCMNDMENTWIETIAEILSMIQYGFSPHERLFKRRMGKSNDPSKCSKYDDGRIAWRGFPIRSQDTVFRWIFDDNGGIQGLEQLAPPHYRATVIPIGKLLLFRTTTHKNNPEGRSALRSAYRPWYMKKNIENIEAIGVERDLAGLPMAGVPPEILSANARDDQKALLQQIKQIVTNVKRDEQEGLVYPLAYDENGKEMYTFKLMTTGGTRQLDTDKIISRYDHRILMTMLADFLLLGQQAVGSYALSSNKTNLFSKSLGAFLDIIAGQFNDQAIPQLFDLNGDMKISAYPKIMHGDVESVDLEALGNYIQKCVTAGAIIPDAGLEKYLRGVAHLPTVVEEGEEDADAEPRSQTEKPPTTEIPLEPVPTPPEIVATMPKPEEQSEV